ncbi:MAG: hypothetical protein DRJ03_30015 [Chloroflexi bacterium]|nr:MAG: hypothetical protein DRJ03_30015 [Chloroflexota bacterium]
MEEGKQGDGLYLDEGRPSDSCDARSSCNDFKGVDRGEGSDGGGQVVIPCLCGCGQFIPSVDKKGRARRYVPGHQPRRRVDWEERTADINAGAPMCECGCGERLSVRREVVERKRIKRWKWPRYIMGHNRRRSISSVSDAELGLVAGTLLGDSSLVYPHAKARSPRLSFNHGKSQEEWVRYKALRLPSLCVAVTDRPNDGYGEMCCRGDSACHPGLCEMRDIAYQDGEKRVTRRWLDLVSEEGMAWWFMDDGSRSSGDVVRFHTEGFCSADVDIIVGWLCDNGYSAHSLPNRQYYVVYLASESSRRFARDKRRFSIPSMEYKFR